MGTILKGENPLGRGGMSPNCCPIFSISDVVYICFVTMSVPSSISVNTTTSSFTVSTFSPSLTLLLLQASFTIVVTISSACECDNIVVAGAADVVMVGIVEGPIVIFTAGLLEGKQILL